MVKKLSFRTWISDVKNNGYSDIGNVLVNYHPAMEGWTSDKFPLYPQTIVLQVFNQFNIGITNSEPTYLF